MDLHNEMLKTFYERAQVYEEKTSWVSMDKCLEPLTPDVFGNGMALDVCAGTGAVSKALISKGWKVISMDISSSMLKQNQFELQFPIIGDMHQLPFLDNFFDLVICRQGLQYASIQNAISEMIRVSSGKVLLGHITLEEDDNCGFWREYFQIASPGRKHIFKVGELLALLQNMNLNAETISVVRQQDYYIGPLIHLNKDTQIKLINLLLNTNDNFKRIYNVNFSSNSITYSNRWEFIKINI